MKVTTRNLLRELGKFFAWLAWWFLIAIGMSLVIKQARAETQQQWTVSLYKGTTKVTPDSTGLTRQAAMDDCLARLGKLLSTTTSKLKCSNDWATLITVPDPPPPSTATLTWQLVTQNTNGTPYTDPFGYVINYGSAPDQLTLSIDVNDPNATTYTLQGLAAGSWYFCVRARNTSNVRSDCSGVVSKTL